MNEATSSEPNPAPAEPVDPLAAPILPRHLPNAGGAAVVGDSLRLPEVFYPETPFPWTGPARNIVGDPEGFRRSMQRIIDAVGGGRIGEDQP